MKAFKCIPLVLLCCLLSAQTAEEIMDKAAQAVGGADAVSDLKSMVTKGTATMDNGMKATMTIYAKEGGKLYVKTVVPQVMEQIQGCNGKDCYSDDQMGLRLLEGQEKEQLTLQNDFNSHLKWRDKFPTAKYEGEDTVDGKKVHKVYLESKAGIKMTHYIDAETFMTLKTDSVVNMVMGTFNTSLLYMDYKDVHNGFKVPMKSKLSIMNMNMDILIDSVEVNVDIPDDKFTVPESLTSK